MFFFFQAEDGIRVLVRSRGLEDVYKRQASVSLTVMSVDLFLLVVGHGCLDGVFSQDGAVDLDRGQCQFFGDLAVLELSLIHI